jgi:23S rRNA (cytidine2498-2'-O)-methyltransferase
MSEALSWSRFPLCAGDVCVELGYAPGGAAQALLDQGAIVLGVDPAEVDPAVLAHPNFRHVRKRGKEVRRSELAAVTWLAADMNVAPNYTLDTVEAIVTHPKVHVQGLLLTLKLNEWRMSENIAGYLDRIRSWGFHDVRARHLVHNRQEICVAALRHRSLRRVRGAGVKQRGGQDAATPAANNP